MEGCDTYVRGTVHGFQFFFDFTSHSSCMIRLELAFSFPFREIYHFFSFFPSFFFFSTPSIFPIRLLSDILGLKVTSPIALILPFSLEGGARVKSFNLSAQNIVLKSRRGDFESI